MSREADPGLHRRRLRRLRVARERAGLSQNEVARALEWSLSKVIRSEGGTDSVTVTDARAMLHLYGVAEGTELHETLVRAARGSRGHPWWFAYRELVSKPYARYLSYETAATALDVYHPYLVPGLLQTSGYAAVLSGLSSPSARSGAADPAQGLARLRVLRQHNLYGDGDGDGDRDRDATARVRFLVDDSALRRWLGDAAVMSGQLERILERAGLDQVSVRVVPARAGARAAALGGFVLLRFDDEEDDVLFKETTEGSLVNRDDLDLTLRHREAFEATSEEALSEEDSRDLIGDLLAQYKREGRADDRVR